MRKRWMAALVAVGLLVPLTGNSFADPPDRADPLASGRPAVTLPTGDRVDVVADGVLNLGDDVRYYSPVLPNGDSVVIPLEALDDVQQGRLDARLFNVDALLRNGITDARTVSTPDILGEPTFPRQRPAGTAVTMKYTSLDGSAPELGGGGWVNLATGESDFIYAPDGVATLNLAPGTYGMYAFISEHPNTGPVRVVGTVMDLTVTDTPTTVAVDATKAKPIDVTVDRPDAVSARQELEFFTMRADGSFGSGARFQVRGSDQLYAIPSAVPVGHDAGLTLRSELASPAGAADAYSYSLFNLAENGIPADPSFVVPDEKLAVRHATYHRLGGPDALMGRENLSYHKRYEPMTYLPSGPVTLGSTRTEYYTADPEVTWSHLGRFPWPTQDAPADDVLHGSGAMSVGTRNEEWLSAPLSARAPSTSFPYYRIGMERTAAIPEIDQVQTLRAEMPLFSSSAKDEVISSWQLPGATVLSKDGTEIARRPDGSGLTVDIGEDGGRYTLTQEATRQVDWTPLGTRATGKWVFDTASVDEDTALSVSSVRFAADGVVDGYAKVGLPQRVDLEFETQPDAADRRCADMTFEVSYDDGATWSAVDIDRDGDHATATLHHPAGAEFVSVRFTAVDDLGQTVETSTIRSYGLR